MNVTSSIWGTPESWTETTGVNSGIGKVATFATNKHTLYDAIQENKLPMNVPINDYSLSWCALGSESNYNNIRVFFNGSSTARSPLGSSPCNFFFYITDGSTSYTQQNMTLANSFQSNLWCDTGTPTFEFTAFNANRFLQPITEFNFKKVVWAVYVEATQNLNSTATGNTQTFTFKNYIDTYKSTFPYIQQIFALPFIEVSDSPISRVKWNYSTNAPIDTTFNVGVFLPLNVYTENRGNYDYAFSTQDRNAKLMLFGSNATTLTEYHILALGDCKRKTTTPRRIYQDENIDNVLESALKTLACFGFYFVLDETYRNEALDSDNMYMGVIPADGVTHGEYTHGVANRDNNNWNWNKSTDSTYDWTKPTDPTHYDKTTVFGSNSLYNTFIQYYALSPANLTGLCNVVYTYINSIDTSTDDVTQSITKTFYTNNPLDVIVSLKKLPFNIVSYMGISSTAVPIKLGNLSNAGATGYKLNGSYTVADFGSYYFFPHFDNTFLDYSPYTYAELIIPFCGSVRLDMAYFMGHTMRLKMVVDLYTGACTCYILADNLCIDSVSGNCAIDVPISGIQSADFQNSVQNAITNVKNAKLQQKSNQMRGNMYYSPISAISGNKGKSVWLGNMVSNLGASLNPISSIKSLVDGKVSAQKDYISNQWAVDKAEYDLQHIETPFNSVGSQSAANSYVEEMQARLIIYRPKFIDGYDATVYGKTEGFACMKTTTVNSCSGLTSGNINLNGVTTTNGKALTEEEKAMIISAFAKGVIL